MNLGQSAPEETIAAVSTPPGEGAIALIRLSGPQARAIGEGLLEGRRLVPRHAHFGTLRESGGAALDDAVVTLFAGPASYTGEDVVEISCHGGVLLTRQVLQAVLRAGARPAEPGEFTQRAFLHGRLDLTQAEAVMDLITAQSELSLHAAREQLAGRLGEHLQALRAELLALLAQLEAQIDFPDEDLDPETGQALDRRFTVLGGELSALLATAGRGRWLREGIRTVIFGAPNVGKSSLLNLLLGYERAIVSPIPGTTRDTVEETIHLRGLPLRLVDTAGLREASDPLEQAGIERTHAQLERADLALHVCDATQPPSGEPGPGLLLLNKIDLGEHPAWAGRPAVRLSCREGRGLAELETAIEHHLLGAETARRDWTVAINLRHQRHLEQAQAHLQAAHQAFTQGLSPEFVAEDLRAALNAVGQIVGHYDTEDLLGEIFGNFCIGK